MTKNYENLANAIVVQAVKDYRMTENKSELESIVRFIQSPWFSVLTSIEPTFLISSIRKEKKAYDS